MTLLESTLAAIQPVRDEVLAEASARQDQLTKPPGSLAVLERIGIRLAGIADVCPPPVPEPGVVGVFAGDHGVCAQGVSPWPQDITVQMLMNMAAGGAAINVLARHAGSTTMLTNVGVAADVPEHPKVRAMNVRRGTADMTVEPAMTREEAVRALEVGIQTGLEAIDGGAKVLMTGEMGIGNTTPASALIAVFTGLTAAEVTGRGAGANDEMLARKTAVIDKALGLHQPQADDPIGVLSAVGGLEHAAIAGFILAGASRRVPVVLDGVIACSAACVAVALDDAVRGYLFSGHAGAEPGIRAAVAHLGLDPLVDLGLRLGEGSGAALALHTVQAGAKILAEMKTFAEAAVNGEPIA